MKVGDSTSVSMPIKNMIGIIVGVSMGIFAYTEITARLTSLETSRELMNADLLKASEQTTVDKEQFILIEDLYKTTDQHTELLNKNIHNQVMLQHLEKQKETLALYDFPKLTTQVIDRNFVIYSSISYYVAISNTYIAYKKKTSYFQKNIGNET